MEKLAKYLALLHLALVRYIFKKPIQKVRKKYRKNEIIQVGSRGSLYTCLGVWARVDVLLRVVPRELLYLKCRRVMRIKLLHV